MVNMPWNGGVRIPLNCNDKSTRSIFKLCQKESACIMDQSYYAHFWVQSNLFKSSVKGFRQSIKVEGVGYLDKIDFGERSLLIVHPAIVPSLKKFLKNTSATYFNNFMLISKKCSLHHFWNVFSPLSDTLDPISESNFDDNILQDNQFICVNVNKKRL
jgi:hypothetical protein